MLSGGAASFPFAERVLGVPVVVAWATAFSPRTRVREEFSDKIIQEFGKVRGRDAKTLLTGARYVRLRAKGMTHEEIAELLTEEAFAGRPEWEDQKLRRKEVRKTSNWLYHVAARFSEHLTDRGDFLSPDLD